MEILKIINLGIRFLLELCALGLAGFWGFKTGHYNVTKCLLGIGAPLLLAFLWGTFGSPKASIPLIGFSHFLLELIVFGLPALAMFAIGKSGVAFIYVIIVIVNRILMYIWGQ